MDKNLLRFFMGKHGDNQETLANAINMSQSALSERINGKIDFRKKEIEAIRTRYELTAEDLQAIFFAS